MVSRIEELKAKEIEERQQKKFRKRLPKKVARTLFASLKSVTAEKDVENAWRKLFAAFYLDNADKATKYSFTSPYDTDGFISADETSTLVFALRLLMEFKNGTDLTKNYDRIRIVCQVIHYMKQFQMDGKPLPTVLVGADENQAFVLMASNFYKYLDGDYRWDVRPSSAYREDTQLVADLQNDANMSVYPFQLTKGTADERYQSLIDLFLTIESMSEADGRKAYKVKVSPATIVGMFDEFSNIAFRRPEKISATESVNLFFQMLKADQSNSYYFLPNNRNIFHSSIVKSSATLRIYS